MEERYPVEFYHALGVYLKNVNKPSFFRPHPTASGLDVCKFIDAYIEEMEFWKFKTTKLFDAWSWKSDIKMNIINATLFHNTIVMLLKLRLCK